ncbi:MAG: endonuclease V [Thermofilaceae archaeon]
MKERFNRSFININRLRTAQKIISEKVIEVDVLPPHIELVCGVDIAYTGNLAVSAAVTVDTHRLTPVSKATAILEVKFPYIPTLLAFREAGPMIVAIRRLKTHPQVIIVDGNGRLHPFGAGVASQVGLALNLPTIGVAKKLLCGNISEWEGEIAPILLEGRTVGVALKMSSNSKPIYVSVGHMISLTTAVKLVKQLTRAGFRLPEPLRLAHIEATNLARCLKAVSQC